MIRTKRWDDPVDEGDGLRVLVTTYLPQGVKKEQQTWHQWRRELAPSKELHAALYPRPGRRPISWEVFRTRYLAEMEKQRPLIAELAQRVAAGQTITLLCSPACRVETRCHRWLLRLLIEEEVARIKRQTPQQQTAGGV